MLNVIALMGRLVADPELRHTPNGIATCTFRIAVIGSLQTRNYEVRNGYKRTAYEVVAENIHFAESKGSSSGSNYAAPAAPAQRPAPAEPVSYAAGSADDFAVIDDNEDLPF